MIVENSKRIEEIDLLGEKIVEIRKKPLLVLYYPDGYHRAEICDDDIEDINDIFRRFGYTNVKKIERLDVLLHTVGGNPDSAYQIAQVIRNFSNNVTFLVPIYAISAGTLMCSCANEIRLGDYGVLSSIDMSYEEEEREELINIHYFMKFAVDCRERTEKMFKENGYKDAETNVESELLRAMVDEVGALKIGKYYREKNLTGVYARRLMLDYMFSSYNNKESLTEDIIKEILYENPSHDIRMDYNMCERLGLIVKRMDDNEFEKTIDLISKLQELTTANVICKDIIEECVCEEYKLPYFYLYDISYEKTFSSTDVQNLMYERRKRNQEFKRKIPFSSEYGE